MAYRVVHWGTGNTGRLAVRGIVGHPDLELVGCYVHNPDKVGQDAGTLVGIDPIGVAATNDVDALLALNADCLSYMGDGVGPRGPEAVREMARFLEAGTDVVSTSINALVYPKTAPPELLDPIAAASAAGGSTFFDNGADPGFGSDLLPLTLLALMDDVDSVRVQEIVNYGHYDAEFVMRDMFGFGMPVDYEAPLFLGGDLTLWWGGVITLLADAMGITLDEIREEHEVAAVDQDVETAFGTVEAGTVGGIRFEVQGIVDGKAVIVVEHDTRIHPDAAPDWPSCHGGDNCYKVIVEGRPKFTLELAMEDEHGGDGGLIACAMRLVNAIPFVCDAPAGLLSTLDLPMIFGRNIRLGA
jgi:4-hydroxy-tetrahydrodipicolinate reductase